MTTTTARPTTPPAPVAGTAPGAAPLRPRRITLLRPWRDGVPDPDVDPQGALDLRVACARHVGGLFLVMVLVQRFATPGQPDVAILVPLVVLWTFWGVLRGVVEVDRPRLQLWLAAAGLGAVLMPLQQALVETPIVSVTSWGLFFVVWLPAVFRVKDRSRAAYLMMLTYVARVAVGLAVGCLVFIGTQLVGVPYTDYLAQAVPRDLLLQDFVISYPVVYGSELYRANAWIGLEPSFVSMQLGLGLIAAFLSGVRLRMLMLIIGGLVAATAGSGLAIVAVAFLVMLGYPVRNNLVRYLPVAVVGALGLVLTPFGQSILSRLTEAGDSQSSTSLRGILPYSYVWPHWVYDPVAVLIGRGPGASQKIVGESGILGLLTPTPVKIFVEYGLLAGIVIAAFILYAYVGGPSRSMSVTLLVSLWLLQPGTTTILAVLPLFLVSTWWAPRVDPVLEGDTATYATALGWVQRAARWRPLQNAATWRVGRRARR